MLLDCWSIPCVILLTWIFLKTKYRFTKLTGVAVCIAGLVLVVFSDVHSSDRASSGSNPVKGDLFIIAGATLYAVSNVSEEFLVKNADRVELMAMLGLFGAIFGAIQISIFERNQLKSIHWSAGAALPFVGFSLAMFTFYSLVPVLLKIHGSTLLNLSLLTSDMWAVLIRIFAYHEKVCQQPLLSLFFHADYLSRCESRVSKVDFALQVDWIYYVAFVGVVVGLIIYSGGDKDENHDPSPSYRIREDEETNPGINSKGTGTESSKI
ncbi:unnamed protein product [Lupinus luteus]|uniref:Solute carrier family 35 member F1 n=1 Tax=Lupinus luteus TaxID=3873 RepID=A0AAV1VTR3_LUPLU